MLGKKREWLTPGRLIPLLTALCAFIGDILGLFGIIEISVAESIILLAVGLLAIDALTERLQLLSRIEAALARIDRPKLIADDFLHSSYQHLPPLDVQLQSANELWVSRTALSDLLVPNEDVINSLVMKGGLRAKFLIAFPKNPLNSEIAHIVYPDANKPVERLELSLQRTIIQLKELIDKTPQGQVEVRFTKRFPLYSLYIVDGNSPKGRLNVHLYNHVNSTPAMFGLAASTDVEWFNKFVDEFKFLWDDGIPMINDHQTHLPKHSKSKS